MQDHHNPQDRKMILADDDTESVGFLLRLRLPWLILGLAGGVAASYVVSHFEEILTRHVALAFFIPFIVYISDAVGTQTETIYVRNAADGKIDIKKYIAKELALGLIIGALLGIATAFFAYWWMRDLALARTVGLSLAINVTLAPILALTISHILRRSHEDPALGAGPFTTIIQDLISVSIYFAIASALLL